MLRKNEISRMGKIEAAEKHKEVVKSSRASENNLSVICDISMSSAVDRC